MRAYDRRTFKRLAASEAARGVAEPPSVGGPQAAPAVAEPAWGRFLAVLEDAARSLCTPSERRSLERLVACGGKVLARGYACGSEQEAAQAWCGHPLCPACARTEGARAGEVAGSWDARVLEVRVPIGRGERSRLPSKACVASLREGWGHASRALEEQTGLPRLEPVPRTVIHPGGLLLFVRLPWASAEVGPGLARAAEQALGAAVEQACRGAGFLATAGVVSREAAAAAFTQARREEADRFQAEVARDLERFDALAWRRGFGGDASLEAALRALAKRWIERVRQRAKVRRQLVLGAKEALAAPGKRRPAFMPEVCPDHGQGCRAVATIVRDGRRETVFEDLRLPVAPAPQAIAAFFEEAAASAPIRIPLPQPVPVAIRRAA